MQALKLSPLPCAIPPEETPPATRGECGFVDEAVVKALMAGPVFPARIEAHRPHVTATANVLDFAGWSLPSPVVTVLPAAADRRASPPVLSESGLGEPHRGPHRWWLAGMAGATCGLLFTALMVHLTAHVSRESEHFITIRRADVAPAAGKQDDTARQSAPELTRLQEGGLLPSMTRD